MLGISSYPQAYVDACRARIAHQLKTYRALAKTATPPTVTAFEPAFFNNLLIALDARFAHRPRIADGHDGNPLDEVRLLARSLMADGGVLAEREPVGYQPATAVLGIDIGDRIALNADDFEALCAAFLAEIESRFPG